MTRFVSAAAFAAIAATCSPVAAQTQDQDRERCYGVALAGGNDGIGDEESPGGASVDFQGDAWTWVPAGACLTLPLPPQPDGTPRRGSYEPLERDAR